jgi:hypothetical protein
MQLQKQEKDQQKKPNLAKLKTTDSDKQDLADYSLEYAVKTGDVSLVSRCIKEGANPNTKSNGKPFQRQPMLSIAASKGCTDICRILLKNGANANQQDSNGYNALMAAIINNHYDASLLLVFHGADPDIYETCSREANNAWDFANGRGKMRLALVHFEDTKELIGSNTIPFGKSFLDCIWGGA